MNVTSQSSIAHQMQLKEDSKKEDLSHLPQGYDPRVIKLVLLCLFFANLFVNIDMGILPAGSKTISTELKLTYS